MGRLRRIETIDCTPLRHELARLPSHLSESRKLIDHHRHTASCALVSWPSSEGKGWRAALHAQKTVATPAASDYPRTLSWMRAFAESRKGWVSRAQIVVLEPHQEVHPHTDWGLYYALRDRYHLVLSSCGSILYAGDQEETFNVGDVVFYPNKVRHGARNPGDTPRVHLIFDILPESKWKQLNRFLWYLFVLKQHQCSDEFPPMKLEQDLVNFNIALNEQHFRPLSYPNKETGTMRI